MHKIKQLLICAELAQSDMTLRINAANTEHEIRSIGRKMAIRLIGERWRLTCFIIFLQLIYCIALVRNWNVTILLHTSNSVDLLQQNQSCAALDTVCEEPSTCNAVVQRDMV